VSTYSRKELTLPSWTVQTCAQAERDITDRPDAHPEVSQHNDTVTLRNEPLQVKLYYILNLGHTREELRDSIAAVPDACKRLFWSFG
jgi:hypothetical protein